MAVLEAGNRKLVFLEGQDDVNVFKMWFKENLSNIYFHDSKGCQDVKNLLEEALKKSSPKLVAIVHAETSTGVKQPLEEIGTTEGTDKLPLKVIRGGSWNDRALFATAASRWRYPSYQPVFDVGFRVAVTEVEGSKTQ